MKREGSPAGVSLRLGRRREPVWDGKGGNAPPQRGSICREEGRALKACSVGFDSVGILFLFCAFVVDCSLSKPLSYAATLRSAGCSESKARQTTGRPTKPDARQLVPVCLLACLLRVFPVVFIAGVSSAAASAGVRVFRPCVCVRARGLRAISVRCPVVHDVRVCLRLALVGRGGPKEGRMGGGNAERRLRLDPGRW